MYTPRSPVVYDENIQALIDQCKAFLEEPMKRALYKNGIDADLPTKLWRVHIGFVPVINNGILDQLGVVASWTEKDGEHKYVATWVSVRILISYANRKEAREQMLTEFFTNEIRRQRNG